MRGGSDGGGGGGGSMGSGRVEVVMVREIVGGERVWR